MRTVLFMTSDGCGVLLTNALPSKWTPQKMIHMEYCRSGMQTHRGNAIETPCRSAAEFAIKAYIIQLKACIKPDPGI